MSRATSLIKRVGNVLSKFNVNDRTAYKRIIAQSGGDSLIGRGVLTDTQDILLDPPPAIRILGPDDTFILTSTGVTPEGSLVCTVSPDAISRDELKDAGLTIVFKGTQQDNEEEYFIAGFNFECFQGIDVIFNLLLRSKTR